MPHELERKYGIAVVAIIAAALLLRLPGLLSPMHSDDFVQAAMLQSAFPAERSPLELYDFGGRDAAERTRLLESGWYPWWSAPELKIRMFRPLTSALIAADHALAPRSPWLWHLHSAAFFVLLLAGAAVLLRSLVAPITALLALCLFAADPCLSIPLSWLPNRGALVSAAFGVWGLYAYVRWRRQPAHHSAALATAGCFVLAVLGGESAWAMAAYPVAFECVAAQDALGVRLRRLVVALGPAALVLACATLLGFGVAGSGLYVNPLSEAGRYLQACLERCPLLAAELALAIPPALLANHAVWQWLAVVGALAVLVAAVRTAASAPPEQRALGVGALLGLPLLAGALPEARLLIPTAIGMSVWLAAWIAALARTARTARPPGTRGMAAALLVIACGIHLGVDPVRAHGLAAELRAKAVAHARWALQPALDDAGASEQEWFVVAAVDFTTAAILPFVRWYDGRPKPRGYRLLSTAPHAHELRRIDRHTLELVVLGSALDGRFAGSLWRPRSQPLRAGDQLAAGPISVRVLRVVRGNPAHLRLHFTAPADDPRHRFLHPWADGLRPVTLPAVGGRLRLPAPRRPSLGS